MERKNREHVLYESLYCSILSQIVTGELQQGDELSTQDRLCGEYQVGVNTVRRALKKLRQDGYVSGSKGRRATVIYSGSADSGLEILYGKRDSLFDLCDGMGLLFPSIYMQAIRSFDKEDLRRLEQAIGSLPRPYPDHKFFGQSLQIFPLLLAPLKNPLLFDMQTESMRYMRMPNHLLQEKANVVHAFETAKRDFYAALEMIRNHKEKELSWMFAAMYPSLKWKFKCFFQQIGDDHRAQSGSYRWYAYRGRQQLFVRVALDLMKKIRTEGYPLGTYLPSLSQLMEQYGIGNVTARAAVSLLCDAGIARTECRKGTLVLPEQEALSPLPPPNKVLEENFILYLSVLQIFVLTSEMAVKASFPNRSPKWIAQAKNWQLQPAGSHKVQKGASLMLFFVIDCISSPYASYVYQQLCETAQWGTSLSGHLDAAVFEELERLITEALDGLVQEDGDRFAEKAEEFFLVLYRQTRSLLSCYLEEERLPLNL